MDNNYKETEITEEEITKLKSYSPFIKNIKTKLEYIMTSISYITSSEYVEYIEFHDFDNNILDITISEYSDDRDSKTILIPYTAIKNKQSFIDWLEEERIRKQKEYEEYIIKRKQRQIEREKEQYELLKAKYGNNS